MKTKIVLCAATVAASAAGTGLYQAKKFLERQIALHQSARLLLARATNLMVNTDLLRDELAVEQREKLVKANFKALGYLRIALRLPLEIEPLPDAHTAMSKVVQENSTLMVNCHRFARLLALECETRVAEQNWGAALKSALDAQRLGAWMQRGGPIVTMGSGHFVQRIARERMRVLLPQLDRSLLETARCEWQKIAIEQPTFAQVLRVETAWTERFYERELTKLPPQIAQRMRTESQRILADEIAEAERPYLKSSQQPSYDDETDVSAEAEIAAPTMETSDAQLCEMVEQEFASNRALYRHSRFGFEKNAAQNSFILVELALRAYELDHKKPATNWDELVPAYLPQAPADPFDYEHSLRLTTRDGKTVSYSIGPDGLDDKGIPLENPTATGWQRFRVEIGQRGDIVSGVNVQ